MVVRPNAIAGWFHPAQVDGALETFGMAMGPLAMGDLAGLDVGYKARQSRTDLPDDPKLYRMGALLGLDGASWTENWFRFL
ncbi:MAG: hypothetical protein CM1200mP40_24320 [Gammaproteobacteria bacterium]|nr:MAG: hypothetical protein CM1200mP40_24320 [Gammaproteobacteria bacterium]